MRNNRGPASLKLWPAILGISIVIVLLTFTLPCPLQVLHLVLYDFPLP